ncbi:substrate-binding periplasmic protein [Haliovirga abyssi]|uniref:Solute-binding protein family 3/N-terminal domain-containing protein n=1 Tax=Haliovirga abyssi TaxID=2996794 RepID=A0AAU9D0I6_9FUSO|nr:transporter substrate-binding domain-containing protein [Haliovirga abyssi]BDU49466.1 hypothetical protein HLVA_00350 [Haliovirga abyssi]
MKKLKWGLLVCSIFSMLSLMALGGEFSGKTFKAAGDVGEWPPYEFFIRKNSKKTDKISGFTYDLLKTIAKNENFTINVRLLPWKRSKKYVETGKYQVLMDASINEERKKIYYYSEPIYTINSYYFYNIKKFPNGLDIKNKSDLKKYKVGGLLGYNYKTYGFNNTEIDTGAKNYTQLVKKLKKNRFDIFLAEYEIMKGFEYVGQKYLDSDIKFVKIQDMAPRKFYFLFPKTDLGLNLRNIFNKNIKKLEKSGELQKMLDKYLK